MKRSRINEIMTEADEMIRGHGFTLPPFAYWSPDAFKARKDAARHVIDARCGWDITDYGAGRYDQMGLFLFTLRNGLLADLQRDRGMCYAEKLLISKQDQLSPMQEVASDLFASAENRYPPTEYAATLPVNGQLGQLAVICLERSNRH